MYFQEQIVKILKEGKSPEESAEEIVEMLIGEGVLDGESEELCDECGAIEDDCYCNTETTLKESNEDRRTN